MVGVWGWPSWEGASLPRAQGSGGAGPGPPPRAFVAPTGSWSAQEGPGTRSCSWFRPRPALPTLGELAGKHPAGTLGFWLKGDKRSVGTGGHCEGHSTRLVEAEQALGPEAESWMGYGQVGVLAGMAPFWFPGFPAF